MLGLNGAPEPEEPYRSMVLQLIRDADDFARETIGLPLRPRKRAYRKPVGRRCCACHCPLDEKTEGCANCVARHAMRELKAQRKAKTVSVNDLSTETPVAA